MTAPSVLSHWSSGQYALGLRHYEALRSPSPVDERWAGYCHLALGQIFEARLCLNRAAHQGLTSARIGLAQLHMLEGQFSLAAEVLGRVDHAELDGLDWILLHRAQGTLAHHHGRLVEATEHLERAWNAAHSLIHLPGVVCAVAHHLAGLYAIRGRDQRAAPYLHYALKHDHTARRPYLLGLQALTAAYQGEYAQAHRYIRAAIKLVDSFPSAYPTLQYELGVISRLCGTLSEARRAFEQASILAGEMGDLETQWYAELGLMSLDLEEGRRREASQHLAQLRQLGATEVMQAHLTLRCEALRTTSDPAALTEVATFFQTREYLREASWAWLRAAEAYFQHEDGPGAAHCLSEVAALVYILGSVASLQTELRTLPLTAAHLSAGQGPDTLNALMGALPSALEVARPLYLSTLGPPRLLQGIQEIKPVMRRSLELLCFLLDHPNTSLRTIQTKFFPDTPPRQAKSYFHQVRDDLKRVAGLEIAYCLATKTYAVQLDSIALTWDVQHLRAALQAAEDNYDDDLKALLEYAPSPFLEGADGLWATEERTHLTNRLLRLGFSRLGPWFTQGKFDQCLSLASHLQQLDPFNDALNEFLIRATLKVNGFHAGRSMIRELRETYQRELALEPSFLTRLDQQLNYN
ncbi:BTAD domain-containing putative transcriptional regulator [Deinococcus arboris]|nr:BTAD domain-containing putative transcriptional regulator [Deinococcus arboris]